MKIRRLLLLAACGLIAALFISYAVRKVGVSGPMSGHVTALKEPVPAVIRSLRPNFPYSVIPGGAYSAPELRYANGKDDLVRRHYADFRLQDARVVQLTDDRLQYVSYRLHNQIFWTKKKLRIPKGEYLLTDGVNYGRARCGNRLSAEPHPEVSAEEPSPALLSWPLFRPDTLAELDLAETPPLGELAQLHPGPSDTARFAPVVSAVPAAVDLIPESPGTSVFTVPPIFPILPPGFAPVRPITPIGKPPATSATPPITIPPPNSPPPVTTVPEPSSLYLFLVTFVISFYVLTRMMREEHEPTDTDPD